MQGLEDYTGLKSLWLENNCIGRIENLSHLSDLRCLFLQHNQIETIENLEALSMLSNLNLASNRIARVSNVACLPSLHTLNLSGNRLSTAPDIEELRGCDACSVLDLSNNGLDGTDGILDVVGSMKNLKVLVLMGNPVVRNTRDYRLIDLRRYYIPAANCVHIDVA